MSKKAPPILDRSWLTADNFDNSNVRWEVYPADRLAAVLISDGEAVITLAFGADDGPISLERAEKLRDALDEFLAVAKKALKIK